MVRQAKQHLHTSHCYRGKHRRWGFAVYRNDKTRIRKFSDKIIQLALCNVFIYNSPPGEKISLNKIFLSP